MPPSLKEKAPRKRFENVSAASSKRMSRIRSKGNRTTEVRLRMALVRSGLSGWTMHETQLPGCPDFVFQRQRIVVFVDGCFWHGCNKCRTIPRANFALWNEKIVRNRPRDQAVSKALRRSGFIVLRFWEHELKHSLDNCIAKIAMRLSSTSPR